MPLLFTIAFRNVLRQRRRSLLTALSMTGGYILCCLSFSLVEGSYNHIIEIFTRDHTGHIQIHQGNYLTRPNIHKSIDRTDDVESVLGNHPAVVSFTPRIFSPALAYANDNNTPAQVIGVHPSREAKTSRLEEKVGAGNYLSPAPNRDGYFNALIGRSIADLLEANVGDELILISQGADGSIANDIFIIQGIVGTRTSWDRLNVFLPIDAARQFLSMGNEAHEYTLLLESSDEARSVTGDLASKLPELTISPWQEVEATFYRTMQSDKQGNLVTLGIIIFIVFIGGLNTVLMSVLERTREFGVLKAIGSRPRLIATMIFLE
ncbi:MAG: ABC transporter permease, partial [Pseudomonadales bacterium]|nr:ABC transporter permease [Pseudomonadales bacterium]